MKCRHFGHYHGRNCRKYPELEARWNADLKPWWSPRYETAEQKPVEIEELATAECPVSLITQDSIDLLERFFRMQAVKDAVGVVSGPDADPGKWPARLVDALVVIQGERDAAEEIRHRVSRKG